MSLQSNKLLPSLSHYSGWSASAQGLQTDQILSINNVGLPLMSVSIPLPKYRFLTEPARICCKICKKNKSQTQYSNKQLNDLKYKVYKFGRSVATGDTIRCRECTGVQTTELRCAFCEVKKSLNEFALNQRSKPDYAVRTQITFINVITDRLLRGVSHARKTPSTSSRTNVIMLQAIWERNSTLRGIVTAMSPTRATTTRWISTVYASSCIGC